MPPPPMPDGDVAERVETGRRAPPPLAERGRVDVCLEGDRHAEPPLSIPPKTATARHYRAVGERPAPGPLTDAGPSRRSARLDADDVEPGVDVDRHRRPVLLHEV